MSSGTVVIAHRGACGYLPEHTLAAKALAHGMGAHFIEQDVVLTGDGVPIVLHDIHLDSTTDVAELYPGRAREDGRYYAIDFTLQEIRRLRLHERCQPGDPGHRQAVYPQRFPAESSAVFHIPTLAEEIDLISGMDRSRNRSTGLYIELKAPNWHSRQGLDTVSALLDVLADTGYAGRPQQVFIQCFDDQTLQRVGRELESPLPLIQLIGDNNWGEDSEVDYDYLRSREGLAYVASYARGIGPWLSQIYRGKSATGEPLLSNLVKQAHEQGLLVHPYTFRRDELPPGVDSFEQMLEIFINQAKIDGLFTDFPDLVCDYLDVTAAPG